MTIDDILKKAKGSPVQSPNVPGAQSQMDSIIENNDIYNILKNTNPSQGFYLPEKTEKDVFEYFEKNYKRKSNNTGFSVEDEGQFEGFKKGEEVGISPKDVEGSMLSSILEGVEGGNFKREGDFSPKEGRSFKIEGGANKDDAYSLGDWFEDTPNAPRGNIMNDIYRYASDKYGIEMDEEMHFAAKGPEGEEIIPSEVKAFQKQLEDDVFKATDIQPSRDYGGIKGWYFLERGPEGEWVIKKEVKDLFNKGYYLEDLELISGEHFKVKDDAQKWSDKPKTKKWDIPELEYSEPVKKIIDGLLGNKKGRIW